MDGSDHKVLLKSPDTFKGLAIIMIVMVHVLLSVDRDGEGSMPVYMQAIYLGLMGFFIISGYFYRPERRFKSNFLRRLKQIMIPMLAATAILPLLMYLYLNMLGYGLPIDDLIESIAWEIGVGEPFAPIGTEITSLSVSRLAFGVYYLLAMVWAFLFFYAVAGRVLEDTKKTFAAIVIILTAEVLLTFLLPYHILRYTYLGLIGAAFMLLGAFLAKQNYIEVMESNSKKKTFYLFPLGGLVAGIGLCYILPPGTGFDMCVFGDYGSLSIYPYFVQASLVFLPAIFISYLLSKVPVLFPILSKVGKHTISILLLHPLICKAIVAPFYEVQPFSLMPDEAPMAFKLATCVITIILCVVIGHLLGKLLTKLQERASGE